MDMRRRRSNLNIVTDIGGYLDGLLLSDGLVIPSCYAYKFPNELMRGDLSE